MCQTVSRIPVRHLRATYCTHLILSGTVDRIHVLQDSVPVLWEDPLYAAENIPEGQSSDR